MLRTPTAAVCQCLDSDYRPLSVRATLSPVVNLRIDQTLTLDVSQRSRRSGCRLMLSIFHHRSNSFLMSSRLLAAKVSQLQIFIHQISVVS